MGCVRKRDKSWNAQVRIAGWRSFTKHLHQHLSCGNLIFWFDVFVTECDEFLTRSVKPHASSPRVSSSGHIAFLIHSKSCIGVVVCLTTNTLSKWPLKRSNDCWDIISETEAKKRGALSRFFSLLCWGYFLGYINTTAFLKKAFNNGTVETPFSKDS